MKARLQRLIARSIFGPGRVLWRLLPQSFRYSVGPRLTPVRRRIQGGRRAVTSARRTRDNHPWVPIPVSGGFLPKPRLRSRRWTRPLVSVVVPTFNDEPYLSTCIRSVIEQGYEDWELIIVDDSSLDGSRAVANAYAENDDRITVVRHERNMGLASTRNTGLAHACGEFVTFLDADDFLFQDSLACRVQAVAAADDPSIVGSWCDWVAVPESAGLSFVAPAGEKSGVIDYQSGRGRNQIISTSPLLRLDVVRSLGGFDSSFRTAEDFEFWTRLFRNGWRLIGTGDVGVAYRQKRTSMVSADPLGHARNAAAVHGYMTLPMVEGAVAELADTPLREALEGVPEPSALGERLVTFLAFAVLSEDDEQVAGIEAMMTPGMVAGIDSDDIIRRAIARHSMRVEGIDQVARAEIADRVRDRVRALSAVDVALPVHEGHIDLGRVDAAVERSDDFGIGLRARPTRLPPAYRPWDVVLHAGSIDACRDLVVVGRELVEAGLSVALLGEHLGAAARRLALTEGIRFAGDPAGPARLQISSDGVDRGVNAEEHVVLCCEPWFVRPEVRAELVIARGNWEVEQLADTASRVELGGWVTRASRLCAVESPRDGDISRSRSDTVIVLRPTDDRQGPGYPLIRAALPEVVELVAGPHCRAPRDLALPVSAIASLVPSARAVVVTGPGIPMDAIVSGTPIVSVTDTALPAPVETCTLDSLADSLREVEPGAVDPDDADWTERHLSAIAQFLR